MAIMDKETGIDAGARNIGRLALAAIPWALAVGVSAWIGAYVALHEVRRQLSQEERAAVYTGAAERPKAKIAVEILDKYCVKVTRVDIDGENLVVYTKNECHREIEYGLNWNWRLISPNGTAIASGYTNGAFCARPPLNGMAECKMSVKTDDRAAKIQVWVEGP